MVRARLRYLWDAASCFILWSRYLDIPNVSADFSMHPASVLYPHEVRLCSVLALTRMYIPRDSRLMTRHFVILDLFFIFV